MGLRTLLISWGIGTRYFSTSENMKVQCRALQAGINNGKITPQDAAQLVFTRSIRFEDAHYSPHILIPFACPDIATLNLDVIGLYRNVLREKSVEFKCSMVEELRKLAREEHGTLFDRLSSKRVDRGISRELVEKTEELIHQLGISDRKLVL